MGIKQYFAKKDNPEPYSVHTVPPAGTQRAGTSQQRAFPQVNWNQYGTEGTEHNWQEVLHHSDEHHGAKSWPGEDSEAAPVPTDHNADRLF